MANDQMTNQDKSKAKKGTYLTLWFLCILGGWSALPYIKHLGLVHLTVLFFLLYTAQIMIVNGLVCWLSYLLVPKTDLLPFASDKPLKNIIYPGVATGILVGLTLYLINTTLFKDSLLSDAHPPFWAGLLASFYGAINEEVLIRLFLFTLVYFLLGKIFRFESQNRLPFLWITTVIVAIVFGLGHLPAAFKLSATSSFEVFRVLLLNGIAGIAFGWLYWSRGLYAAMTAHFAADVVIHAVLN